MFRSRQLKSTRGLSLRPTSDRLRETLFNVLAPFIQGARFLELFAGTGAVGIEALSRGAAEVVFVENHSATATLIRENLASLGVTRGTSVMAKDADRALETLFRLRRPFDIVYLDPPYAAATHYDRTLRFLGDATELLAKDAIVVVEHHSDSNLAPRFGFLEMVRHLKQSDAALTFYRRYEESSGSSESQQT